MKRMLIGLAVVLAAGGVYAAFYLGYLGYPSVQCNVGALEKGLAPLWSQPRGKRGWQAMRLVAATCEIEPEYKAILLYEGPPEKHQALLAEYMISAASSRRRFEGCGSGYSKVFDAIADPELSPVDRNTVFFDGCGMAKLGYTSRAEVVSERAGGGVRIMLLNADLENSNVPVSLRRQLYRALGNLPKQPRK